jgi:energy-coupling factor transporter ATP-binding protein EcfA2
MSSLAEIAQQLKDNGESIILIYGFNSTGKTRLSVEYKDLTKANNNGKHAGVYYNAYSEDLFIWDNDEEHGNASVKLDIVFSSLNQFHNLLIVNPDLLREKLALYHPKYFFKFNSNEDPEKGIDSITFTLEENGNPKKISRGEERIFVWCFFLALFEVDGWADVQDAHYFIDDPVSSLDDHNIFITANTIFDLIEKTFEDEKRIIITTHHIGLFSILSDRLFKGEKSKRYKNITKLFILNNRDNDFTLKGPNNDVFLFHLHLLQTLEDAIRNQLFIYHFVLLRQALENINSFLGKGGIGYALEQIGIVNVEETGNTINSLSHKDAYHLQFNEMSPQEEALFKDVFQKILNKYKFILH